MPPMENRPPGVGAWHDAPLSWPAVLASLVINALAWSALWLVYERATHEMASDDVRRIPIVWLRSSPVPLKQAGIPDGQPVIPREASAPKALASTASQAPDSDEAASGHSTSAAVTGSDRWYSDAQGADTGGSDVSGILFPDDPLQLRRHRPIPAGVSRLQLRMRSAPGLAAIAQLKACGALLRQWEGMRMDAAAEQVPLGLHQPAGRDAVWRSLQAEGCLD